jgi:ferritin-like metal-binding protein YciE
MARVATMLSMADPTLKDVLDLVSRLDAKIDAHRAETKSDLSRLDAKIDAHRAETNAHRAETAKGFASSIVS